MAPKCRLAFGAVVAASLVLSAAAAFSVEVTLKPVASTVRFVGPANVVGRTLLTLASGSPSGRSLLEQPAAAPLSQVQLEALVKDAVAKAMPVAAQAAAAASGGPDAECLWDGVTDEEVAFEPATDGAWQAGIKWNCYLLASAGPLLPKGSVLSGQGRVLISYKGHANPKLGVFRVESEAVQGWGSTTQADAGFSHIVTGVQTRLAGSNDRFLPNTRNNVGLAKIFIDRSANANRPRPAVDASAAAAPAAAAKAPAPRPAAFTYALDPRADSNAAAVKPSAASLWTFALTI